MKKSRENDSSLELLLDTMCNTFGGVMFIAIALTVVLSIVSKVSVDETAAGDLEAMKKQLSQLQSQVDELHSRNQLRKEVLKTLENDPRKLLIQEIMLLEQKKQELELKNNLLLPQIALQKKNNQIAEKKKMDINSRITVAELQKNTLDTENTLLENKIFQLQEEIKRLSSGHISFKTMSSTRKTPYFLAVYNNSLWRIGPEISTGKPHSDMSSKESDGKIICEINSNAPGVPLLENGKISQAAMALLDSLPADRFPNFSLHSNSVRDFCIMREYLKKENRTHGINTQFDIDQKFVYAIIKSSGDYEAY